MFTAQQINIISFALVAFIVAYVIFLAYIILNASKAPKILRMYIKDLEDKGTRKYVPVAIGWGALVVIAVVSYLKFI